MFREQKMSSSMHFPKSSSTSLVSTSSRLRDTPARRKSSTTPLKIAVSTASELASERERSKLVVVEAQRIIAVVDEAILSLQVVARISSVCENHDYFGNLLGKELSTAFVHLCTSLKYPFDGEERGLYNRVGVVDSDAVENLKQLSGPQKLAAFSSPSLRRIRDLVKKIVRLLLQKRGLFNMVCGDTVPSPKLMEFVYHLDDLRRFVYEKLTMSDENDKKETKFFQEASMREEAYKKEISQLDDELNDVKTTAAKEISALKDKIARLEDDIEKMVTISSEAILQKRIDTIAEIENEERMSKAEKTSLEEEFKQIEVQYSKDLRKNRDNELNLRKRNFKLGAEVENWVTKYDHDMDERLTIFEQINEEYTKEKEEMKLLEAEFAPIQQAYNILMEERAEKERLLMLKLEKEAFEFSAAVVFQKYVRGFLARCLLRRLKARAAKAKAKQRKR